MKDNTVLLKQRKRRFGDRYDGYRVRKLDTAFWLIPNIMRQRSDSQIFFEEKLYIDDLEKYIREKRNSDIPEIRMVHVILAAVIRTFGERPRLNRFVAGKKIYSHNNLRVSMTVKRQLVIDGEETEIMPYFEPTDSLYDVVRRFNEALNDTCNDEGRRDNETDKWQQTMVYIPTFLKSFVVLLASFLDNFGLMPKAIYKASPFHSSFYLTDVGSIGIDAIYHHLYNFGTTTAFVAVGKKKIEQFIDTDGSVKQKKYITLKFVLDERVCDGFYYAKAIKHCLHLLKNPQILEKPLENLPDDM